MSQKKSPFVGCKDVNVGKKVPNINANATDKALAFGFHINSRITNMN